MQASRLTDGQALSSAREGSGSPAGITPPDDPDHVKERATDVEVLFEWAVEKSAEEMLTMRPIAPTPNISKG